MKMSLSSVVSEQRCASAAMVSTWMRFQGHSDLHRPTCTERESLTDKTLAPGQVIFGCSSQQLTDPDRSTNTLWHFGMQSGLTFHIYVSSSENFILIFSAVTAATVLPQVLKLITIALAYLPSLRFHSAFQSLFRNFQNLIYAKKNPNPNTAPQVDQQRGAGRSQRRHSRQGDLPLDGQ